MLINIQYSLQSASDYSVYFTTDTSRIHKSGEKTNILHIFNPVFRDGTKVKSSYLCRRRSYLCRRRFDNCLKHTVHRLCHLALRAT